MIARETHTSCFAMAKPVPVGDSDAVSSRAGLIVFDANSAMVNLTVPTGR